MFFDYDNLAIPEIHTGRKKLSAGSDCTLPVDDGYVSIRVGAIIIKDGKVLMVKNERQNYMYSVGGRVKFGETSIQAVEREVYEETGVHMEVGSNEKYYPEFFRTELNNPCDGVKHIVTMDINK